MNTHTHTHHTHFCAALHLVCRHRRQLAHVEVQDVEQQATGRLAAALQQLSRQQLQEPGNNTEQTHNARLTVAAPPAECPRGGGLVPAVPVALLQHLEGLSEHEADQL